MVSLLFHGVMVAELPAHGTSQLLTRWPPHTWAYHLLVQPQQLKRRPTQGRFSTLKSPAIIFSFPLPSRHSVLLIRSLRTSSLLCAIASHQSLMTHERHVSFSNASLLRFNGLMLSASPTQSAILMYKCDVASWDTPSSWLVSAFTISNDYGNEVPKAKNNNNNNSEM